MSSSDSLGSRILSGIAWKAGSQLTLQLTRMVVALVLARLLAPHEWGLAAMVLVFSGFVAVFTDNALGTALIQRRDVDEGDRSTVFWISAGVGVTLAAVGVLLAEPLASFYREPDVRWLFVALSGGILVGSLGTTHMALLVREMSFGRLELRQIAATLVGATVGVSLAVADYGAWAIVGQMLGEAVVSTLLLWLLSPWRPTLTFSTASVRKLGGFAGNVLAENMLWQGGRTLASVLIGRLLGAAALGTYTLATTVILMPFARIAAPLQQVFFPAFAQISDDRARMADIWIRATRLIGALSVPALVGLIVVAPDFVQVVLGPKWDEATIVIQVLAIVGVIQSLQTLNAEVLLALGKASTLVRYTALWLVATTAAVVIGQRWELTGVAVAYTVATLVVEPVRAVLTTRALGIPLSRFVRSLRGVGEATMAMGVVLVAARAGLEAVDVPPAARLLLLVPVGGAAYAGYTLKRSRDVVDELAALRRRRAARSETPGIVYAAADKPAPGGI